MPEVVVIPDSFAGRLGTVLRDGLRRAGISASVETEPVPDTLLHRAVVTSPQFAAMEYLERQDVLWRILSQALEPAEKLRVSLLIAMTPDELNGE